MSETPLAGARELPGAFALPGGLVDAHFHATLDFEERALTRAQLLEANLRRARRAGVLAARDMGQPPDAPWLVDRQGPRFTAARTLLVPPGRYFPGLGEDVPPERLVALGVEQARAGAAWVKVVLDFPGEDGNWFAAPRNYSAETLTELVAAVHAEGARVAVHTTGPAVADAVRAGRGLDRARPVARRRDRGGDGAPRDALGADAVDRREPPERRCAGAPFVVAWRERMRTLLGACRCASACRCSPAPTSARRARPGARCAQLVATGGLTPAQALAAATTVPRRALGLPGHPADLVTYDAGPALDVRLAAPAPCFAGATSRCTAGGVGSWSSGSEGETRGDEDEEGRAGQARGLRGADGGAPARARPAAVLGQAAGPEGRADLRRARRGRQGRDDQAPDRAAEPARRDRRGAARADRAREHPVVLPALRRPPAGGGRDRHLRPLLVQPRRRRAGARVLHRGRARGVDALLPRVRADARALRDHPAQVLVLGQRRRAGAPLPGARPGPAKRWKLSPMDLKSREKWVEFSKAKDEMFAVPTSPRRPGTRSSPTTSAPRA